MSHRSRPDTPFPLHQIPPKFTSGGSSYLVYHYYDAFDSGDAWVQVRPLTWVGGWPVTGQALVPVPGEAGPPGS